MSAPGSEAGTAAAGSEGGAGCAPDVDEADAELREIAAAHARGLLSGQLALMRMLIACEDVERVAAAARVHPELAALLAEHHHGCARIVGMLRSGVDSPAPAASVEQGIASAARLFDWSVRQNEESSVALYSLGSPELLDAATAEVVEVMDRWGLLAAEGRLLQIGSGIGRIERALAGRVAEAHGVDVSANMIAAARRRCLGLRGVFFHHTDGRDLRLFAPASFDLVYAVDSFPYLVQAGMVLVETHFAESARVLAPGGALAVFQLSYRDDLAADAADVARLAARHGFEVEVDGAAPFRIWDAHAWRLRRRG
jgi:predicted TPR repeat methyltransferase